MHVHIIIVVSAQILIAIGSTQYRVGRRLPLTAPVTRYILAFELPHRIFSKSKNYPQLPGLWQMTVIPKMSLTWSKTSLVFCKKSKKNVMPLNRKL